MTAVGESEMAAEMAVAMRMAAFYKIFRALSQIKVEIHNT